MKFNRYFVLLSIFSVLFIASARAAVPVSDGKSKIVFTSSRDGDNEVFILVQGETVPTQLTFNTHNDRMPCISPDGNKILWASSIDGNSELFEMNIDGSSPVQLTFNGSDDLQPRYSPDGTKIVFSANRDCCDYDAYVMDRDGGNVVRVAANTFGDYHADFSPDMSQLAFLTFYGNTYVPQITKRNLTTGAQQQLTSAGDNANPSWSSADRIVFSSNRDGNEEIYAMNADGSSQVNLTQNAGNDYDAAWRPDGEKLVFSSTRDGDAEIYSMNANGTEQTRLTNSEGNDSTPFWGPPTNTPIPPVLSVSSPNISEGDSGTRTVSFTLSLSAISSSEVTVDFQTGGTATPEADYIAKSGTARIAAGITSTTVNVTINGDTIDEENETVTLNLTNPKGARLTQSQGVVIIVNDDPVPILSLNDKTITEGNEGTQTLRFTATLSKASGRTVTAQYRTVNGTATAGSDYSGATGTITFAPGVLTRPIDIKVQNDLLYETTETFRVELFNLHGASLLQASVYNAETKHFYELISSNQDWFRARAAAQSRTLKGVTGHLVTITSAAEQSFLASHFEATYFIGLYQPTGSVEPAGGWTWVTGEPFLFNAWTNGEPNNGNGDEHVAINGPNAPKGWNDVGIKRLESYLIEYDTDTPTAVRGSGIGTIFNDDTMPSLSVNDIRIEPEGNSGSKLATFTVSLSNPSGAASTVEFRTTDITATGYSNYSPTTAADYSARGVTTLTIPANTTSQTVSIYITGDGLDEEDETFSLDLANATNATIADAQGIATIVDDDATPTLSINDALVKEGTDANASLIISLSAPSGRKVNVNFATSDNTARAAKDYSATLRSVTFNPGITSQTVAVPILNDAIYETSESFYATLSSPQNATVSDAIGIVLISDNDPALHVNVSSPANNAALTALTKISGTASSATGTLTRVAVVLRRKTASGTLEYWAQRDGVWGWNTASAFAATLPFSGQTSASWNVSTGSPTEMVLPSGSNLLDGRYYVHAYAYDSTNNSGQSATNAFAIDTTPPVVTVTSPTAGAAVPSINAISGTVVEKSVGSGISQVQTSLRRLSDSLFWNGSAWVATTSRLAADVTGTSWTKSGIWPSGADLQPGKYRAYAFATNKAGLTSYDFHDFTVVNAASNFGASPVQLSSAAFNSATGFLTLSFTGQLAQTSTDTSRFGVLIDGRSIEITSVALSNSSTLQLSIPKDAVTAGTSILVNFDLLDTTGRSIRGQAKVVVR